MKKKLKIVFYGDGKWALNTLKKLQERQDCKIDLVISRYPSGDKEIESFCKLNNLNYECVKKYK